MPVTYFYYMSFVFCFILSDCFYCMQDGKTVGGLSFFFSLSSSFFILFFPLSSFLVWEGVFFFFFFFPPMKGAIGRPRIRGHGTFGPALVLVWFIIIPSGGTYKLVSQQEVAELRKLLRSDYQLKILYQYVSIHDIY